MPPPSPTRTRHHGAEVVHLAAHDHIPPHDGAAEADLLASAMQSRLGLEVLSRLPAAAFYVPANRELADTLQHAAEHGWRPETTIVIDQLSSMGLLDDVGGAAFVFDIAHRPASSASASRYAQIIERHWRARLWLGVAFDITEAAYAGQELRILGPITDRIEQITTVALDSGPPYANLSAILGGQVDDRPPELMDRGDGLCLFYAGALNYLHGEPGKGKSWVAFHAAAIALGLEQAVTILDFEDTPRGVAGRLKALGVSGFVIGERAFYVDDPHSKPIRELVRLALAPQPRVVIIDGVSASMTAANLDEDKAPDVNKRIDTLARPIAASGAIVIAVDHVTKSKETRGLWPRGSGAKRARIDGAAYAVEPVVAFTRSTRGHLRLRLAKDRAGFIGGENDIVALFHVNPRDEGRHLEIELRVPRVEDKDEVSGTKASQGVRADVVDAILKVLTRDGPKEGPIPRGGGKGDEGLGLLAKLRALPGPGGRGTMTIGTETLSASLAYLHTRGQIIRVQDGRKSGWALPPKAPTQPRLEELHLVPPLDDAPPIGDHDE